MHSVIFEGNEAKNATEIYNILDRPDDETEEDIDLMACGEGGGGAACVLFNLIPDGANADFYLENVTFSGNLAEVGGAVYLAVSEKDWNPNGAKVCEEQVATSDFACNGMRFVNVNITENVANLAAGGIFVSNPEYVVTSCDIYTDNIEYGTVYDVVRNLKDDKNDFEKDLYCTRIEDNIAVIKILIIDFKFRNFRIWDLVMTLPQVQWN